MSRPQRLIACGLAPPGSSSRRLVASPGPSTNRRADRARPDFCPDRPLRTRVPEPPSSQTAAEPARSKEPHPARDRRRSPRSQALADAAPPLPTLVGSAAPGRDRAHLRPRLHRAVARDPDPDPANDRQRDRRRRPIAPPPLPGADHRNRDRPLRDQLHPPLRDCARRDRRRGAAARDDVRRLPPVPARLLRPARDR